MSKRKKWILALLIVNILLLIGSAVMFIVFGVQISHENHEYEWMNGYFNILLSPTFYFLTAGYFVIKALIVFVLGIFTYRGRKGPAIALLIYGVVSGVLGYLGAAAAIIALVKTKDEAKQA